MIEIFSIQKTAELTLTAGNYFIQLWGSQGGSGMWDSKYQTVGGKGSYVTAYLHLNQKTKIFVNIGSKGRNGSKDAQSKAPGGWNGGGAGGEDSDDDGSGAGGGATDLRIGENLLANRIMVAAGGSGSATSAFGAPGGDTKCYTITVKSNPDAYEGSADGCGSLGFGEDGKNHTTTPSSGAGGGYYGGRAVSGISELERPAVSYSGSSFVAGFPGQDSLSSLLATMKTSVTSPKIFAGFEVFPAPDGGTERATRVTASSESHQLASNR